MGNNQSRQIHQSNNQRITSPTVAASMITTTAVSRTHTNHNDNIKNNKNKNRRSRSPPHYSQQANERPNKQQIKTEPPSSALSGCTTRHGTADPTMSSNYNDTTTSRPRRSSSSARQRQQQQMDSGYSGSRWSSTLFSHAPQTTSSSITTISSSTSLNWGCVLEEETIEFPIECSISSHASTTSTVATTNAMALINADPQLQQPPPYYCYPHPEVDEQQEDQQQQLQQPQSTINDIGVSTERVLRLLETSSSPQETYKILDAAFARARLLQDSEDRIKAFQAALKWSQRELEDDDDNSNDVAAVWVARCHMDGFGTTKEPVIGFNQLKTLVDRGCWQAFYPLAMCYLEGVKTSQGQVIQPVDKEIAYQWFSTVAQLEFKTQDALPIIALAQFRIGSLLIDEDPKGAIQWFLKSSNRGNL